jgi:hypothetical protein
MKKSLNLLSRISCSLIASSAIALPAHAAITVTSRLLEASHQQQRYELHCPAAHYAIQGSAVCSHTYDHECINIVIIQPGVYTGQSPYILYQLFWTHEPRKDFTVDFKCQRRLS